MSYAQCNTFFVESDDHSIFAKHAEKRERVRAIARDRQRSLAEELSRMTSDEYGEDILELMEYMEVTTHDSLALLTYC